MKREDRVAIAIVIGVVALLFADVLFLGRGLFLNDLTSYHYPMKWVVRDVIAHGDFPSWNRYVSSGQPLAANPAYEVFYPPQWLLYVLPFHWALQFHIVLHLIIAAAGMYLLLRDLELRAPAAVFGALAFALCGPMVSLTSKLPLLFSIAWMPLALCFARRFILTHRTSAFAAASLALAMQFIIGEPAMALQTWAILGGYVLLRHRSEWKSLALLVVAPLLIAAVQLLPAVDHAHDSVRSKPFDFQIVSNWSMPPERVEEMLLPSLFRTLKAPNGEPAITAMYPFRNDAYIAEMYLGALVVVLALAGFFAWRRGAGAALALIAVSLVVAFGDHTPLLRVLYDLHLFRSIRYPEKFVLTAAFAFAAWAAFAVDRILAGERAVLRNALVIASLVAVVSLFDKWYFARAALVIVMLLVLRARRTLPALAAIGLAFVAELYASSFGAVPRMPRDYFDPPKLATGGGTRVFHEAGWEAWENKPIANQWGGNLQRDAFWRLFRNAAMPNLPAYGGREMALEDDIDQTSLLNTDQFLEAMKLARASNAPNGDAPYLAMSNAGWRIRWKPFAAATQIPIRIEQVPTTPRYSFAERIEPVSAFAVGSVRSDTAYVDVPPFMPARGEVLSAVETSHAANIRVRSSGRALLVMSVTAHKYWSAQIDGAPATLLPANVAYQALVVPAGEHTIVMRYGNPLIRVGMAISLVALGLLTVVSLRRQTLFG